MKTAYKCIRCGLTDDSVFNLDGSAAHRELFVCISKLRQHCAAVEAERDYWMSRAKAERILAALREPSEAVGKAAADEMFGIDVFFVSSGAEAMYRAAAIRVIRAAVAAAEQEVAS